MDVMDDGSTGIEWKKDVTETAAVKLTKSGFHRYAKTNSRCGMPDLGNNGVG